MNKKLWIINLRWGSTALGFFIIGYFRFDSPLWLIGLSIASLGYYLLLKEKHVSTNKDGSE